MTTWQTYLESHRPQFQEEMLAFLHIPSISSLPEHADAVAQAAEWVAARLERAGGEHVQILPTGGHPVVYGDWLPCRRQADGVDLWPFRHPTR